jgi:hypothetical protein
VSNNAKIVLWMGLFMIAFGIVKDWPVIRSTLFGPNSVLSSQLYQPGINAQKRTAKRSVTGTVPGSRL